MKIFVKLFFYFEKPHAYPPDCKYKTNERILIMQ